MKKLTIITFILAQIYGFGERKQAVFALFPAGLIYDAVDRDKNGMMAKAKGKWSLLAEGEVKMTVIKCTYGRYQCLFGA